MVKKCDKIWNEFSSLINKEFISEPLENEKYTLFL